MQKLIKLSTAVIIMLSMSSVFAASAQFEKLKEELWFKGESALMKNAGYEELGEVEQIDNLQGAWEAWQGTVVLPEELEVGLAMWTQKK